jgi:hypothetical protein
MILNHWKKFYETAGHSIWHHQTTSEVLFDQIKKWSQTKENQNWHNTQVKKC